MTYSKLFQIPLNRPLRSQPIFSKRIARPRKPPRNRRKHEAKLNDIVYYMNVHAYRNVRRVARPMRVMAIDDCSLWSSSFEVKGTTTNRNNFMIYYDLQPLIQINGIWKPKPFRPIRHYKSDWMKHNRFIWNSGWIGHAVDMDEFTHTYSEALWRQIKWR